MATLFEKYVSSLSRFSQFVFTFVRARVVTLGNEEEIAFLITSLSYCILRENGKFFSPTLKFANVNWKQNKKQLLILLRFVFRLCETWEAQQCNSCIKCHDIRKYFEFHSQLPAKVKCLKAYLVSAKSSSKYWTFFVLFTSLVWIVSLVHLVLLGLFIRLDFGFGICSSCCDWIAKKLAFKNSGAWERNLPRILQSRNVVPFQR